ncbi:MAG: DNA translocase FtsK [Clostridiaceae bacterium]|nr:DNA translocase FtsK [Clostridiaceae bacterium]
MPKQTNGAVKTVPKKSTTATKKASGKTAAQKPASAPKAPEKPAKSAQNPPQRRELWVLSCFFLTILFSLAAFVREGVLIAWLHGLTLGLIGWGAYLLPFAALADCLVILFARGKPVAARLTAISLIPLLGSMAVHLFLSTDFYTWADVGKLYKAGQIWISGGLFAGGLAELASAVFSHVGALILTLLLMIADVFVIWRVKLTDISDYILDMRDAGRKRREDPLCDDYPENAQGYIIKETPDPLPEEMREVQRTARERAQKERRETERIALDKQERAHRESTATEASRRAPETESEEPRIHSRTPDLPLEPVSPERTRREAARRAETSYTRVSDDPEPLSEISKAAPTEQGFTSEPTTMKAPAEPTPYAMERWARQIPARTEDEFDEQDTFTFQSEEPEDIPDNDEAPWDEDAFSDPITLASEPLGGMSEDLTEEGEPVALPGKSASRLPETQVVVVDTHKARGETATATTAVATAELSDTGELAYEFPPVGLLKEEKSAPSDDATEELRMRSQILTDTLQSFGVQARISGVIRGPSVTRYELQLDRGVKLQRLTVLQNDIALALGATGVRIAPIPDKMAVGIEVPNKVVQFVYLREVLLSQNMTLQKSRIAFALGRDITGDAIVADIHKMPHLLIAGTTGSGKSVCINSIIVSLLYRATPKEVRFIMIDPKMVELGDYNGIPHLLIPVVTDYKKAPGTLAWAVSEMERRYKLMAGGGARDLTAYNRMLEARGEEKLPSIVIIIDELADLMMVAAKEIEEAICRIAQKARAAGMHLIIATQRPSADVLTGLMKSNIPSRIAFAVASQVESRIILDQGGAEKLIGRGDMLFMPIGAGKPLRVQGCFLSDAEIEQITAFIKEHSTADYSQEIIDEIESASSEKTAESDPDDEGDPMLGDAIDVVMETGQASASMLQRRLKLGYARAARIIDQMEARGIIGPFDGSRPRQILISRTDWQEMKMRYGARS